VKQLFLGLFLIVAVLAAHAEKIPEGGTVTIAVYDDPKVLNPLYAPEGAANLIGSFFADQLVMLLIDGRVIRGLAESWDISPDQLTWTIHLRKGVRFTDGSECTSEDVLLTYTKGSDPKYGGRNSDFWQHVREVRAEDKYTIEIALKKPDGLLLSLLGRGIVPASYFKGGSAGQAAFDKHPIGTGPFKLSSWEPGRLVFDANPDYFLGKPHLDRVIFKVFEDNKKAWVSLMQGETDLVAAADYEDYALIKDDPRFATYAVLDDFCVQLLFNNKDPLFSDRRIRQAISAAIDRNDLVSKVLQGGGVAATGPFKPGTWPFNPDPSLQAFDPRKASRLLSDLGWKDTNGDWILDKNGKPLRFTVLTYEGDKFEEATAKRLQWQLLQVGVRMDVEVLSVRDFVEKRLPQGAFMAALCPFNVYYDPDLSATRFWSSPSIGGWNVTSYSNSQVDRLVDEGRSTSDFEKRKKTYQKIFAILADDSPAAFLYFRNKYTAATSRLKGIESFGIFFYNEFIVSWYLEPRNPKERR
jgi:peptide/nickel transport system substrate-binding protein